MKGNMKHRIIAILALTNDPETYHFRATEAYIARSQNGDIRSEKFLHAWTDIEYEAEFCKPFADDGYVAKTLDESHAEHADRRRDWCPICRREMVEQL